MGMIFRRKHIDLILEGKKIQTRRRHKRPRRAGRIYSLKSSWIHRTEHKIKVDRVYEQRLGDVTPEEALKEGGYTIEEFMELWEQIVGSWGPNEVVIVHEFHLIEG